VRRRCSVEVKLDDDAEALDLPDGQERLEFGFSYRTQSRLQGKACFLCGQGLEGRR